MPPRLITSGFLATGSIKAIATHGGPVIGRTFIQDGCGFLRIMHGPHTAVCSSQVIGITHSNDVVYYTARFIFPVRATASDFVLRSRYTLRIPSCTCLSRQDRTTSTLVTTMQIRTGKTSIPGTISSGLDVDGIPSTPTCACVSDEMALTT